MRGGVKGTIMLTTRVTLADLINGITEDICQGCPPDRVCAWACRQGMGVTDNAIAALLGFPLDTDTGFVQRALCECYA